MIPDYEIVFGNRGDAQKVLDEMYRILHLYGAVTVADLYELSDLRPTYTDNKYGWTSLSKACIAYVRHGYIIALPKPMLIDTDEEKEVDVHEPLVRMINETENEFIKRINTRLEEGKLTPNAARKSMGLPEVETETVTLYADNKPIYTVIREKKAALDDMEAVKQLYPKAINAMKTYCDMEKETTLDDTVNRILKSWGL